MRVKTTSLHGKSRAVLGDHNAISDISGFKFKASEMRKMEGVDKDLLVHWTEWNPEHPQLHIIPRIDDQTVINVRENPADIFAETSSGDYLLQNGDTLLFNASAPLEVSFN